METARRPYKGYGPIDFFAIWDIWAWRPGEFLLAQIKSNYCSPGVKEVIAAFKVPPGVRKQVVIYRDYVKRPEVLDIP